MMRRRGPGLMGTMARTAVIAGTATAVSGGVAHRQQRKYAEKEELEAARAAAAAQPQAAPASAALEEPDYMAELQRLSQLKSQGILTEEEFQAKKKQLLGI